MHTSYAPEKIDKDSIEIACSDLEVALINVLDNNGDDEECERARDMLNYIDYMIEDMAK